MKLYQQLAQTLGAFINCRDGAVASPDWQDRHEEHLEKLVKEHLPSGSGFDNGTRLDLDESQPDRLVFITSFHHMNDAGYYVEWTDHKVIVKASLAWGFRLLVFGKDKNQIKDYIRNVFQEALSQEVP